MKHFKPKESIQSIGAEDKIWNTVYLAGDIYTSKTENVLIFKNGDKYSWHEDSKQFYKVDKDNNFWWSIEEPPPPPVWVVPGKVKYGDEAFVFTVKLYSGEWVYNEEDDWTYWYENLHVMIPVMGSSPETFSDQVPYNWVIDWGDGIVENKSGLAGNIVCLYHDYLTGGVYTVIIKPVVDEYQWLRALGNFDMSNTELTADSIDYMTNKSLMKSASSYGNYYMDNLFCQSRSLIYPANEVKTVSEDGITQIGDNFKNQQYELCYSLTIPEKEWMPPSITQIGSNFRGSQYSRCETLSNSTEEYLSNSITTIGGSFRSQQYYNCSKIQQVSIEVLPDLITNIGSSFRYWQYSGCRAITTPTSEIWSNNIINIGDYFRSGQYLGCQNLLTSTPEVLPNTVRTIGTHFRASQYSGCSKLQFPAIEVFSDQIMTVGNYFRSGQYLNCTSITSPSPENISDSIFSYGTYFRSGQYSGCTGLTGSPAAEVINPMPTPGNYFRYRQYYNCPGLLIGNHVHISMNLVLNVGTGHYNEMFYVSSALSTPDTIPIYFNLMDSSSASISTLTPSVQKKYCTNRTGITGYASLHANWK